MTFSGRQAAIVILVSLVGLLMAKDIPQPDHTEHQELPAATDVQLDWEVQLDSPVPECPVRWNGLFTASCEHCSHPQTVPEGLGACVVHWDGLEPRCVVPNDPTQLCTIDSQVGDDKFLDASATIITYGNVLTEVCGSLIGACNSDEECIANLAMYTSQAYAAEGPDPRSYCSVHQDICSPLFGELLQCAFNVANIVPCSTNSDCPDKSLTCVQQTGLCSSGSGACCNDMSDLACCGCVFGGLTATQFQARHCVHSNLQNDASASVIHPTCLQACRAHSNAIKLAKSGCHDDSTGWHDYGESWTKGCYKYVCKNNGKISKSKVECPHLNCPSKYQIWYYGQCCPTCLGCKDYNDQWKTCGVCDYECPEPSCPDKYQYTAPGQCCPSCLGCKDGKGKWHYYGEQWQSGCKVYECEKGGKVTWSKVECDDLPCPKKYQKVPAGQCCPACKACNYGGEWQSCDCQCEDLHCPKEYQYTPTGECCSKCQGCQDEHDKWHHTGEKWQVGCTLYECKSSGYISSSKPSCPSLPCPRSAQVTLSDQCCPTCKGCKDSDDKWHVCKCDGQCDSLGCPEEYHYTPPNACCPRCQGCKDNKNKWHYVGETWQKGCDVYTCDSKGSISKKRVKCPKLNCPSKYTKTYSGQCCPTCIGCKDSYGDWYECQDECHGSCPHLSCPKEFQSTKPSECCPTCQGCKRDGTWHHYNEVWQEDCKQYVCQPSGSIKAKDVWCADPPCPSEFWVVPPKQCCPVCRGCKDKYDGKWYHCSCDDTLCPELDCPKEIRVTEPGTCCPTCYGCKDKKGKWHYEGDCWFDGCTKYTCSKPGKITTSHIKCPKLPCAKKYQQVLPGKCCPYCKACHSDSGWSDCGCESNCDDVGCPAAVQYYPPSSCCPTACHGCKDKKGKWHQYNEVWHDKCTTYECLKSGKIKSSSVSCDEPPCPVYFRTVPPGQCCAVCLGS